MVAQLEGENNGQINQIILSYPAKVVRTKSVANTGEQKCIGKIGYCLSQFEWMNVLVELFSQRFPTLRSNMSCSNYSNRTTQPMWVIKKTVNRKVWKQKIPNRYKGKGGYGNKVQMGMAWETGWGGGSRWNIRQQRHQPFLKARGDSDRSPWC